MSAAEVSLALRADAVTLSTAAAEGGRGGLGGGREGGRGGGGESAAVGWRAVRSVLGCSLPIAVAANLLLRRRSVQFPTGCIAASPLCGALQRFTFYTLGTYTVTRVSRTECFLFDCQ